MRKAKVFMHDSLAGLLSETDSGYTFLYDSNYIDEQNEAISITLPLTKELYRSEILFPFFDGLIPEGWLLDVAVKNWKFDYRDRMSILLATCSDCIGAVSILPIEDDV